MSYPKRLYPHKDYKIISNPDPETILCRWTEPGVKLIEDDKKLSAEAFEDKSIPGLSINGIPESIIEDCYIEFINKELKTKYTTSWNEGEDPSLVADDHFKENNQRGFFLIKLNDVIFEDTYPFPPKDKKTKEYSFKVYVRHKPLVSNYFHFELEVFDMRQNKPLKNNTIDSEWKKIIGASIKNEICQKAKFTIQDFKAGIE